VFGHNERLRYAYLYVDYRWLPNGWTSRVVKNERGWTKTLYYMYTDKAIPQTETQWILRGPKEKEDGSE